MTAATPQSKPARGNMNPLAIIGLLLIGLVIGAGIVYGAFGSGGSTTRTVSQTQTATSYITNTVTNVNTVTTTQGAAQTQTLTQTVTSYVINTLTSTTTLPATTVPGSKANITFQYANLVHGNAGSTAVNGHIDVVNSGTENAAVDAIYLTYGGQTCNLVVSFTMPYAIVAGAPKTTFNAGSQVGAGNCNTGTTLNENWAGVLYISNGKQVAFAGTFF